LELGAPPFALAEPGVAPSHGEDLQSHPSRLDVRANNRDAVAFYAALGYAPAQLRMARRLA